MIKLAVVADDLTGANDTGAQFTKFGLKTIVVLDAIHKKNVPEGEIIVIDSDSRALPPADAYVSVQGISQVIQEHRVRHIYKKIDSTLRGNLGSEIAAMCEVFKPRLTVIAPAFPQNKRVTVGGFQLLEGLPVSLTEISDDPKTPVKEAWIPQLLYNQVQHKVGAISLQTVLQGPEAIQDKITEALAQGEDWLVFDAVSQENLRHIAQAAMAFEQVLWVGSAGLAGELPEVLGWPGGIEKGTSAKTAGMVIVVAGSASKVTHEQLTEYCAVYKPWYIEVDPIAAVVDGAKELERALALTKTASTEQCHIVITCESNPKAVQKAIAAGKSRGLGREEVGARIAGTLAKIVLGLEQKLIAGLFLTGGETAVNTCRVLQAEGIEVMEELMPGIPLGQLVGGPLTGTKVVTKAGAFGDKDAIVRAVQALQGERM